MSAQMVNYLNKVWEAVFSPNSSSWRSERKALERRAEPAGRARGPTEFSRAQAPGRIAESDPAHWRTIGQGGLGMGQSSPAEAEDHGREAVRAYSFSPLGPEPPWLMGLFWTGSPSPY